MCDSKANQGEMQEPHHSLIVRVVSSVLDKLISGHVESPKRALVCGNDFIKFQSSYAPDVSIESYLERIRRYSRCSDACFVMALIYVDRLIESKNLVLTTLNAHRLLITSVMLAAKFHDDLFYNNAYYSKLGGLSLNELNHLESELLHLLDFSLFVKEVAYCKYSMQLQNYVFYLDVVPPPRSAGPMLASMPAQQQQQQSPVYFAPQVQVQALQQSLRQAALGSMGFEYPAHPSSALRVPSPDNPHAKACSFSEQYLSTNSPLRIAPSSACAAANSCGNARQALLQAQAQVLSLRYSQQQQQQQPYFRDSAECSSSVGLGGYFNNYTPAYCSAPCSGFGRDPMRDSIDETSTTCSTRTASPYPAGLYSRSGSSSMLLAGAGSGAACGGAGHSAALTPSMYPAQGVLHLPHHVQGLPAHAQQGQGMTGSSGWGESFSQSHSQSQSRSRGHSPMQCSVPYQQQQQQQGLSSGGGYQRGDLCIQTDLMDAYPMQRSDSNASAVSVATPYSAYHHPAQQQQYRQSPASRGYAMNGNTASYPSTGVSSSVHTPSHYAYYPQSAQLTPTERRYQPSYFTPSSEVYHSRNSCAGASASGGMGDCEASVSTPRDCYSADAYAANTSANSYAHANSAYNPFPCPSAMLYASSASMHQKQQHQMQMQAMHGAMSDPMNFYGYSAGVNAGQM